MRATSAVRACPAMGATWLVVPLAADCLRTSRWWSAHAATCGRWVTHSTWRSRPRRCSSRPTVVATAPPTPESTSSNTSVPALPSSLVVTAMASARRDNSPPDATRSIARGADPACAETKNCTDSRPCAAGCARRSSATANTPPCMPSVCIAAVTAAARRGAALARRRDTVCAAASYAARVWATWFSSCCRSPDASSAASSCRHAFSSAGNSSGGRR